ncbi:MAG: four helix bundle protein [Bacteroidetes bacterium HGW-Bacteroidetes-13]|nr:MAG: four helix bundle protein [Bacteroidetes bacterium HGW-Bacteroidetes-13]
MSEINSFKDLLVWQKGIELVKEVYKVIEKMPQEELFGLSGQIKRSVLSVPSNIAEGWGRNSTLSYLHFLKISRGSLFELETQLIIAKELEFISSDALNKIDKLIHELSKMLNSLIKSIKNKSKTIG